MRGCTCRGGLPLCPVCQALAARAGILPSPGVSVPSEGVFLRAVLRVAREAGWLAYHTHDSRKSLPGYPDVTLCHPTGPSEQWPIIFAELKVPGGSLTLPQHAWLDALTLAEGKEVYVWTPDDWPQIQARLRR